MRFGAHRLIQPLSNPLYKLIWLAKLSKWRKQTKVSGYNDFYTKGYVYENRYKVYAFLCERYRLQNVPVNYIEFGVEEGNSMKWWLQNNEHPSSIFVGLDTFEGLPEKWGPHEKGAMAFPLEQVTINDARVTFFKGLFQQTANEALNHLQPAHRTIFHMDADLFSSTLFALTQCYRFMKPGDLIIFDEFTTPVHEFRAFLLFTEAFYVKYEVVAAATNYSFLAVEIKGPVGEGR